jgi:peroxiredoxin
VARGRWSGSAVRGIGSEGQGRWRQVLPLIPCALVATLLTSCAPASDGDDVPATQASSTPSPPPDTDGGNARGGASSVRVGAAAPDYAITTLAGDSLRIGPGPDVVLVNVWATWCVSCKEEFALMNELLARHRERGFRVVAVSVDAGDVEAVERVAAQYAVRFEIAHDRDGRIEAAYPAIGVPASYLIGRDGRLLWKRVGVLTPEVDSIVAEALGTPAEATRALAP